MEEFLIILLAYHPSFDIISEGWKLQSFLFYSCTPFVRGLHLFRSLNGKLRMRLPTALDLSPHNDCIIINLKLALMLSHI